jgi:hypothetical protein
VVPRGEAAALLAELPVAALRIDEATAAAVAEVGIDTLGGVLALPARSLASRFPPLLCRRLAEFRGTVAEPIVPPGGEALPQESQPFDVPVRTSDLHEHELVRLIEGLLGRCLAPLVARGEGVLALQVRLEHGARMAVAQTVIDVGLFRPTASLPHLAELVRLRDHHDAIVAAREWLAAEAPRGRGDAEDLRVLVVLEDLLVGVSGREMRLVDDHQARTGHAPAPHERLNAGDLHAGVGLLGLTGHDETSENLSNDFVLLPRTPKTLAPGAVP